MKPLHFPGRWAGGIALCLTTLLVAGCETRVAITGKVLNAGQPLPKAELRWVSESDSSLFVGGATDASGNIIVDAGGKSAIPVGNYKVTVVWWRLANGKPLPDGEEGTAIKGKPGAAKQFSATLDVEITKGTTQVDLDVTGKGTVVGDIKPASVLP
ncbi:MAG: hypothetical protein EXS09_04580 [Gemmataceae bacterium]|nr:hypothetical protein [Gemmataceae bacterium]